MKSDRKPPLVKSPMRLRTRRSLKPCITSTPLRTPLGSIAKTQMKKTEPRSVVILNSLEKMMKEDQLGAVNADCSECRDSSMFERGRLYDVYSERRDERLRKKQREAMIIDEPKTAYSLNLKVNLQYSTKKKISESSKKPIADTTCGVDRSQHSRYALRSMSKKPPLPVQGTAVRKTIAGSRSTRKLN